MIKYKFESLVELVIVLNIYCSLKTLNDAAILDLKYLVYTYIVWQATKGMAGNQREY